MTTTIIEGAHLATNDDDRTAHVSGHLVTRDNLVVAVGPGPAPAHYEGTRVDGTGCLATRAWSTPITTSTSG